MKTIIAATRTATLRQVWDACMTCPWQNEITRVLCGMAKSDLHGRTIAINASIPVDEYHADWNTHGKAAGPIRNQEMADNADALIAAWDGLSRGTADMIRRARAKGLRVHVYNYVIGKVMA